ncbi:MAG: hypothetical protein V1703_04980 [Candidatus Altiarchaeota archaeon]
MDSYQLLFRNFILGSGFILGVLLIIEALLYYKSWGILHKLKDKIKMPEDKKKYAVESTLSIISLVMTAILNLIILIVLLLCMAILLYGVLYLTKYFLIILVVVVLALLLLVYICIKLIRQYNEPRGL